MAIDPFYEHYYETGIDITGEIDDSQEEECGCDEARFEQTRITPENILTLDENAVFVFGSNIEGQHYGGAARVAYEKFGAVWGDGVGLRGQSFAIPTMDGDLNKLKGYVELFIAFAAVRTDLMFYVTPIGCGIAGYTSEQIAPFFKEAVEMENIALPKSFWKVLNKTNPGKVRADYACLDFETANEQPSSVCSVGIVWVKDKQIIDSFYSLIQPEPNYYQWFCQNVHGLGPCDTDNAQVFPKVWAKVADRLEGLPLVAHNAKFDEGCLKAVMRVYQMDYPDYEFYDTLKGSRDYFGNTLPNHQLQTSAAACGFDLRQHHNALADAEACAHIAMTVFEWK